MVSLDIPKLPRAWNYWLLLATYLLFLVLGALVFVGLEARHEDALRQSVQEARQRFLLEHDCIVQPALDKFLSEALQADNYGVSALGNSSAIENWEYTSALFFAVSVLTTTGYGHTVPLSDGGKIFCIIYTFLGIPITLFLLTSAVNALMRIATNRPISYIHARWGYPLNAVAMVHAVLLGLLVFICFILLPAFIFWAMEDGWNFLESVYFCFISLSTIGLGDYIPGRATSPALRELYKFSITCYLIVGLIAMLLAIETFSGLPEIRAFLRLFKSKHKQVREDDRLGILSQDELALEVETLHSAPLSIISGAGKDEAQRTDFSEENGKMPVDVPQE
ncbi:potassium channel subfamily K member 1-like [Ambystoma mexicanum]|uniref:potassium channel subfamily K member 1-like n=1 Tax=Ambystoma mexicanum TaxID=8296 RepID=UPI0037E954F4